MKHMIGLSIASLILISFVCQEANAWETSEHRQLCDSAFFSVMKQYCQPSGDTAYQLVKNDDNIVFTNRIWHGMTFGEISALSAKNDLDRSRFHERGKTILEQLHCLTARQIQLAWNEVLKTATDNSTFIFLEPDKFPPYISSKNVVSTYLMYHLMALHMVELALNSDGDVQQLMNQAVFLEAIAQGYLTDAFSAGHILTPVSDIFVPLHPRNTKETHNYYRSHGVYVINSRGDAWQTFGHKLIHWRASTYQPVFSACQNSLMELLAVFCHVGKYDLPPNFNSWLSDVSPGKNLNHLVSSWLMIKGGDYYYSECRMPTLMLLPVPITSTWSFRTDEKDEHGIRRHRHFPQLREAGLHDPNPGAIDWKFLYSRSAMPDWLIPPPFNQAEAVTTDSLIKFHPDWASVSWIQNRSVPPSYKGILFHVGGQLMGDGGKYQSGGIAAVGYGFWDDLLLVRNVSASIAVLPSVYESNRLLLVPSAGFGVPFTITRWFKALRLEAGGAFGLGSKYKSSGSVIAIGVDGSVWQFGFTNAGITWRLKYQWFNLDRSLSGPSLEFILQ